MKLSQREVALCFGLTGKRSRDTVSAWELGKFRPSRNKRSDFQVYLTDTLGLRKDPEMFRRVWSEVMVDQWQWEPLTSAEWQMAFPRHPVPSHLANFNSTGKNLTPHLVDWGQAPDISRFYGRQHDLEMLSNWISIDRCRLVGIVGLGGIGKTTLATKLAHQLRDNFDVVIFRTLKNAPYLDDVLLEYFYLLSNEANAEVFKTLDQKINHLIECLRKQRCLLVLDNFEAILLDGTAAGYYRPGYEAYGQFIYALGAIEHQSCLLLTSREKAPELIVLEGNQLPVRSLKLTGLPLVASQQLLADKKLSGDIVAWQTFVNRLSGNPLLLKISANLIHDIFDGQLVDFLEEQVVSMGSLRQVLDKQLGRLSSVERELMFWLVVEREGVSQVQLRGNLLSVQLKRQLVDALSMLLNRSLVIKVEHKFVLHNVVLEYMTDRLVEQVCDEIENQMPSLLNTHALVKADVKDYIRESQSRLILRPIIECLRDSLGQEQLEIRLSQMLVDLHELPSHSVQYAAGNILNILIELGSDLSNFDFSGLVIRQAYLVNVKLRHVDFSGAELHNVIFQENFGGAPALAFSHDGRMAAGTTSGDIRLWDINNGSLLLRCSSGQWLKDIAFSPDGQLLAGCGADSIVRIWDTYSGVCVQQLSGHTDRLRAVAFSGNGRFLASGGADLDIRIWDVETGNCVNLLSGHENWVLSLAFAADGETLASSSKDGTVRIWNISNGQCLQTLSAHDGWVHTIAFNPTSYQLASGGSDHTVRLWDTKTGTLLKSWTDHTDQVKAISFSPDGDWLASSSNDRTVKLRLIGVLPKTRSLQGHTGWVEAVAFSPDGQYLATGGYDQSLRLWDVEKGLCLRTWQSHTTRLDSLTLSPDGQTAAASGNRHVSGIWNIQTQKFQPFRAKEDHWLWAAAFSPNGRLLANGGYEYVVQVWEVQTGQSLFRLKGHRDWVRTVAFNPNGRLLASGSEDHTIRIWDVEQQQCLQELSEHSGRVRTVAFSPTGEILASGSADQTIRLWAMDSAKCTGILRGHEDWVFSVAFSPDGRYLISGSGDQTVRLWDIESGRCISTLLGHSGPIRSVAVSPNGKKIASGSIDQTVRLWERSSGRLLQTFSDSEGGEVKSVTFGQDGHQLISASGMGVIKLWDIKTGKCIQTLRRNRPYEHLNITGLHGVSEAQKTVLLQLGAVELS